MKIPECQIILAQELEVHAQLLECFGNSVGNTHNVSDAQIGSDLDVQRFYLNGRRVIPKAALDMVVVYHLIALPIGLVLEVADGTKFKITGRDMSGGGDAKLRGDGLCFVSEGNRGLPGHNLPSRRDLQFDSAAVGLRVIIQGDDPHFTTLAGLIQRNDVDSGVNGQGNGGHDHELMSLLATYPGSFVTIAGGGMEC